MPQDAWFYSREGERIGPVTFSELLIKAKESALNPRLDMVWTQGMAEWKPAGEIEGLFERRAAPEPQESLAPAATNMREEPDDDVVSAHMSGERDWPGARRRGFLFSIFIFPLAWTAAMGFGTPFLQKQFGDQLTGVITVGAAFVPLLVFLYFSIQRFANLGMSRLWFLGHFVPILNFWTGYRSFACPAGYAYHKKLDGIGIFLAILYWLWVLLWVLLVVGTLAILLGAAGSPEIQEKLQELMRQIEPMMNKP